MRKQLILCLSLSNLCFLPGWLELFRFSAEAPEQMRSPAALALFGGTACNVVGLGTAFYIATSVLSRVKSRLLNKVTSCAFLFVMATALDWLTWQIICWGIEQGLPRGPLFFAWAAMIAMPLMGCLLVALYDNSLVVRASRILLKVLAPVPALFSVTFAWVFFQAPPWPPHVTLAVGNASVPQRRVAWLIFDEWDQRLMFDVRPGDVHTPEVDRLLTEAVYCTKAEPPAWDTPESISSLLLGRGVSKLDIAASGDSRAQLKDGNTIDLRRAPTVFSETLRLGIDAGLAGWFLPYCMLVGPSLSACYCPQLANVKSHRVGEISLIQLRDQLRLHWIAAWFGQALMERNPMVAASIANRQECIKAYLLLSEKAASMLKDPSLGLVFLHWTVPHPPGIWNRHSGNFTTNFSSDYLDNLELVDVAVGQVRRALREGRLADRTSLIVTSDHPFRPDEWSKNTTWTAEEARLTQMRRFPYVPFIVKVAGDKRPVRFDQPFNTITSSRLVLRMLSGEVEDNQAAASWLAKDATHNKASGF